MSSLVLRFAFPVLAVSVSFPWSALYGSSSAVRATGSPRVPRLPGCGCGRSVAPARFLSGFPKGADLHVHLSGAVYAESFIRAAGEDGLCVDPAALSFAKPPCTAPLVPAAAVPGTQDLYDRLINAFSMRSFVPTSG